jgi:uncharacterized membrane protein YhaH (DUF805 family)
VTTAVPAGQVPLDQPLYGATPVQAVVRLFKKYVVFSGRASRSEFWWATLFFLVGPLIFWVPGVIIGYATGSEYMNPNTGRLGTTPGPALAIFGVAGLLLYLAILLPSISVTVRRLHDANFSGFLYLLSFVPVGSFVLLVLAIMESNPEGVRFDEGNESYAAPPSP